MNYEGHKEHEEGKMVLMRFADRGLILILSGRRPWQQERLFRKRLLVALGWFYRFQRALTCSQATSRDTGLQGIGVAVAYWFSVACSGQRVRLTADH